MKSVRVLLILFRVGIELMALGGVGPWVWDCTAIYFITWPKGHFYQMI